MGRCWLTAKNDLAPNSWADTIVRYEGGDARSNTLFLSSWTVEPPLYVVLDEIFVCALNLCSNLDREVVHWTTKRTRFPCRWRRVLAEINLPSRVELDKIGTSSICLQGGGGCFFSTKLDVYIRDLLLPLSYWGYNWWADGIWWSVRYLLGGDGANFLVRWGFISMRSLVGFFPCPVVVVSL